MLKTERHNIILSVLKEEGVVSVSRIERVTTCIINDY